ncbi:MAG: pyridoxamine 5'-phosphate oxidase family protein [Nocardioidaceae bacterium]
MSTGFIEMSAEECRERVADSGIGRVVWCAQGQPKIVPVNYALVDGEIMFRTAPYTDLGRQIDGQSVVFEIDRVDYERLRGWSIVVRAEATTVDDPDTVARLRRVMPQPWAGGQRMLFVRLRPRAMTGRYVSNGS